MTTIKHEIQTKAAPEAVYAALTTQAGIEGWWAKDCDLGSGVGANHELRFVKEGNRVVMKFVVEQLDAGRQVTWKCTDNANPIWPGTTLSWRIEAGVPTKVTFEHAGFKEAASPPYQMTAGGWEHFMKSLATYLDSGAGEPW